jgi:hypothetical protein
MYREGPVEIVGSPNRPIFRRDLPHSSQQHFCWNEIAHSEEWKVVSVKQREAGVINSNNFILLIFISLSIFALLQVVLRLYHS